jgi:hypothetical protein
VAVVEIAIGFAREGGLACGPRDLQLSSFTTPIKDPISSRPRGRTVMQTREGLMKHLLLAIVLFAQESPEEESLKKFKEAAVKIQAAYNDRKADSIQGSLTTG